MPIDLRDHTVNPNVVGQRWPFSVTTAPEVGDGGRNVRRATGYRCSSTFQGPLKRIYTAQNFILSRNRVSSSKTEDLERAGRYRGQGINPGNDVDNGDKKLQE